MTKTTQRIIFSFSAIALSMIISTALFAKEFWGYEKIKGNGNVTTKERSISSFTKIHASSGLNVILKEGEVGELTIQADDNLHEIIKTEVNGNQLKIYTSKNISSAKAKIITVYLQSNTLKAISCSSSTDVDATLPLIANNFSLSASSSGDFVGKLKVQKLDLSVSSSADVKLRGSATEADISTSSSGDLDADDFIINNCDISSSSSSDAKLHIIESLIASVSSSGEISVKGNAQNADVSVSSSGDFNGFDFKVANYNVKASSGAEAEVFATKSLNARASSGGDINYKGNPDKIETSNSSGGDVSSSN